jgi:hypothetical protein
VENNNYNKIEAHPLSSAKKSTIIIISFFIAISVGIGIFLYFSRFNVFLDVKPGTVSSVLSEDGVLIYTDPLCGSCAECKSIVSKVCKEKKIRCKVIEAPSLKGEDLQALNEYGISRVPSLIVIHDNNVNVVNEDLDKEKIELAISVF